MKNLRSSGSLVLGLALAVGSAAGHVPQTPGHAAHVPAYVTGRPAYPLKVSLNQRYLVDQLDEPFLMMGDSPQGLIANLSTGEADAFFANREAAGFNAVWINLLCGTYTGGNPDGSTFDGLVPFKTPGDIATPNRLYFARVDRMLQLAAQHGIQVVLDPAE